MNADLRLSACIRGPRLTAFAFPFTLSHLPGKELPSSEQNLPGSDKFEFCPLHLKEIV
jgi:hypothetical protein